MRLKWDDQGIKSPLTRARGLGAAHEGAAGWMSERISAVAALPLMIWLVWSVLHMPGWSYETFIAWLAAPVNAVLMILSVLAVFWHAALGCRVIVEDYVHNEGYKIIKLIVLRLLFTAAAIACVFSILKIAFAA